MMLKASGRRRRFESAEGLRVAIAADRQECDAGPPAALQKKFKISLEQISGWDCYILSPRSNVSLVHAMYLHGGAHVAEMSRHHWQLLADLVNRTGCTVHVPIYPLAPEHSYRDAFPVVSEAYGRLVGRNEPCNVVLMGDSSGGGLALAMAQQLNSMGLAQPRDIVLISPWLDLTVSHPQIGKLERRDPWLAAEGLAEAGRMWAAGDDMAQPPLTPINGSLRGLGRLTVFIGGRDIFMADCRRLRELAEKEDVEMHWVEEPDMIHVWPLLPLRKAAIARAKIAEILMYPSVRG